MLGLRVSLQGGRVGALPGNMAQEFAVEAAHCRLGFPILARHRQVITRTSAETSAAATTAKPVAKPATTKGSGLYTASRLETQPEGAKGKKGGATGAKNG